MARSAMLAGSEVRSFRDLEVWRQAMDLAEAVHKAARQLPSDERYELGRDLRRSSTSVPSNIAEGFNRHSRKSYRVHVAIALGSTGELGTQLEWVRRLNLLNDKIIAPLIDRRGHVGRLAQGLWRSLKPVRSK